MLLEAPVPAPPGPDQHHATVALAVDGTALVAWVQAERTQGLRLEPDGAVVAVPWASPVHHPQLRSDADGWWMAATERAAAALHVVHLDPTGEIALQATFTGEPALFPDLVPTDDGVVVVSTDNRVVSCRALDRSLALTDPVPCPSPVDPTRSVGTLAVQGGPDGPVVGWAEATSSDETAVYLWDGLHTVELGVAWCGVAATGSCAGARPMVLTDPAGHSLVAWRGAETLGGPWRSHLQPIGPDGTLAPPWLLGVDPTGDVGRPTIADHAVGGRTVVAWEEEGGLWLQLRQVPGGGPLGDPFLADAGDPDREARRPALSLRDTPDGLRGVVSWESAPNGSETDAADRTVWIRRFVVPY